MNYMLKNENSIYYECGYSCDNALYIRLGSEAFFITDSRYTIDAKENVKGAKVVINGDLYGEALKILKKSKVKKVTFDPKEWTVAGFEKLSSKSKITFKAALDLELKILSKAAKLGAKAFKKLAKEFRTNGFAEDEFTLTHRAKTILSDFGKYELSFDPIVAINASAAKPHATPTNTKLSKNDLLLVDAGLKYKRYCSDRTRTVQADKHFTFDTHQKFKRKKIQKAYDTVLKAHDHAIAKARSGMKAKKVDALTRDIITKTIEPGIYMPNEFGIRIEDMVAMVDGKAVVL
jgi:Xaa-Pro aminopeptidase